MNTKDAITMLHSLKYINAEKEFETKHNDDINLIIDLLNIGEGGNKRLGVVSTKLMELQDFISGR